MGRAVSVEPDEAGGLIWPFPTKVFADLLLLVVTLQLTERATRTALLEMYVLTGRGHLVEVEVEAEVTLQLTVSQYVLVSSTLVGLATRYYFLSEFCRLKFAVLYLLGALSDEKMSLQFAV
jgi:hypothetical protein